MYNSGTKGKKMKLVKKDKSKHNLQALTCFG